METDDGGWTLLITLGRDGTAASTVNKWPSLPQMQSISQASMLTGMFKGRLASFSEVREEIASDSARVYGSNLTETDLNTIRMQYAFEDRALFGNAFSRPSCRLDYLDFSDATAVRGCAIDVTSPFVCMTFQLDNPSNEKILALTNKVVGWAVNYRAIPNCAFGDGVNQRAGFDLPDVDMTPQVILLPWSTKWKRVCPSLVSLIIAMYLQ
jgi:hypothetical protein